MSRSLLFLWFSLAILPSAQAYDIIKAEWFVPPTECGELAAAEADFMTGRARVAHGDVRNYYLQLASRRAVTVQIAFKAPVSIRVLPVRNQLHGLNIQASTFSIANFAPGPTGELRLSHTGENQATVTGTLAAICPFMKPNPNGDDTYMAQRLMIDSILIFFHPN